MHKVTKPFIYRAKLFSIGQEIPEQMYQRLLKDKVAIRRGVLDNIVSPELEIAAAIASVEEEEKAEELPKSKPKPKTSNKPRNNAPKRGKKAK